MKMFSACLNSNVGSESFSKIYGIDMDVEPIKTSSSICSSVTPLLVTKELRSDSVYSQLLH
ncbi:MAG: hypothetical protein K6G00_06215 [Treponema sp.]|nr:hypothetical protein [Treponema sp.]